VTFGSRELREYASQWLGDVPGDWNVVRFKRAATIRNGQVDPEDDRYKYLPLFAPNHIEAGTGRLLGVESADEQAAESGKFLVSAGEVVYSKIRPALRKVIVAPCKGLCSADMYPIQPASHVDARFLFYSMLSEGFSQYALLQSDRVAMPKINRESLGGCLFAYPEYERQLRVVASLDRKTSAIDALVAKKERMVELLQEKRQAVIAQAVTQGLVLGVPMRDSTVPWLGMIPAHWSVRMLKYVATFQRGHDLPAEGRREGNFPVVSSGGTIGTHDAAACKGPGIVTGRYGSIGRFQLVEGDYWALNTALYTKNLWGNKPKFVWYALSCLAPLFVMESNKSAVPGVDRNDLHVYAMAVPPRDEQEQISRYLDAVVTQIDRVIVTTNRSVDRLREYRQALITAAVTGQLDLTKEPT
jgi:type I restriction enzyme S subunit